MDLPSRVDTAIIGAGHNGLAMSRLLSLAGRDHVVIERRETLGGGWQDRWDAFRLVSPNWTTGFPGQPYDGDDADGFMPRDAVVATVRRYAETIGAPVVAGTLVRRVSPRGEGGFVLETDHGPLAAKNVVVACGAFHVPRIPEIAAALPARVTQVHSHAYRRALDLPAGAVLVVGTGQTGVQIAEELQDEGREVYLSVGTAGRVPRRYRGRDVFRWLEALGLHGRGEAALPSPDQLPTPMARFAGNPSLSGHKGGHSTDLRAMAESGITLVGRIDGVDGERLTFAPGLAATLAKIDGFFGEKFQPLIERYIEVAGEDVTADDNVWSAYQPPEPDSLDLGRAGISTVLWTSGFRPDYAWIDAPITDDMGLPVTRRGVSELPGLYFVGALWQTNQLSATLFGPRLDTRHVAGAMGLRLPDEEPIETSAQTR